MTTTTSTACTLATCTVDFAALKHNAATVKFYAAEARNAVLSSMRSMERASVYAAACSDVVQSYLLRAAVAADVLTAADAENLPTVNAVDFAVSFVMGFVSVTTKGNAKEGYRRFYRVKGMGLAVKAVRSLRAESVIDGEFERVAAPETKNAAPRTPRPMSAEEKISRAYYRAAKLEAEAKHDATKGKFEFPKFADWNAARTEVTAE